MVLLNPLAKGILKTKFTNLELTQPTNEGAVLKSRKLNKWIEEILNKLFFNWKTIFTSDSIVLYTYRSLQSIR